MKKIIIFINSPLEAFANSFDFDFLNAIYMNKKLIKNNQELMNMILEIKDADIEDGGDGAFYIYLKKIIK